MSVWVYMKVYVGWGRTGGGRDEVDCAVVGVREGVEAWARTHRYGQAWIETAMFDVERRRKRGGLEGLSKIRSDSRPPYLCHSR